MKPSLRNGPSILNKLRDAAYDTVFHVGDTGLQFVADLIHGPHNVRQNAYGNRQQSKQERTGEKPLKFEEKKLFTELLKRQDGERLTDFWKRRKAHLASASKPRLISQFRQLQIRREQIASESSKTLADQKRRKLEAEFRQIARFQSAASQRKTML